MVIIMSIRRARIDKEPQAYVLGGWGGALGRDGQMNLPYTRSVHWSTWLSVIYSVFRAFRAKVFPCHLVLPA